MTSLQRILEQAGVGSEALDELVLDAAAHVASRINNGGLAEQLEFLEAQGVDVLKELGLESAAATGVIR